MILLEIPGYDSVKLKHLVLDYNGTLAVDGIPVSGVIRLLNKLSEKIDIHIITADTFGTVTSQLASVKGSIHILKPGNQLQQKADYIRKLGPGNTIAIGNGANDAEMLKVAILGIALIQTEGAAISTLLASDIACNGIMDALNMLTTSKRLVATLRK